MANKIGIKLLQELAVIGLVDIQAAAYSDPGLTTILQPMKCLGEVPANLLLYRLRERAAPIRHEVLTPELVVRGSCGCPDG